MEPSPVTRGKLSEQEAESERIADLAEQIHTDSPDKGYRRIRDDLERYHDIRISDKRALRICRSRDIKSTVKYVSIGTVPIDTPVTVSSF